MTKSLWSAVIAVVLGIGLASAEATPVYFAGTGSYYDFVAGSSTWMQRVQMPRHRPHARRALALDQRTSLARQSLAISV